MPAFAWRLCARGHASPRLCVHGRLRPVVPEWASSVDLTAHPGPDPDPDPDPARIRCLDPGADQDPPSRPGHDETRASDLHKHGTQWQTADPDSGSVTTPPPKSAVSTPKRPRSTAPNPAACGIVIVTLGPCAWGMDPGSTRGCPRSHPPTRGEQAQHWATCPRPAKAGQGGRTRERGRGPRRRRRAQPVHGDGGRGEEEGGTPRQKPPRSPCSNGRISPRLAPPERRVTCHGSATTHGDVALTVWSMRYVLDMASGR